MFGSVVGLNNILDAPCYFAAYKYRGFLVKLPSVNF